jgi:hypothetical protein
MIKVLVTIARIAPDVERDATAQTGRAVQADCTVAFWCADCETGNLAPGANDDALLPGTSVLPLDTGANH